MPVQGTSQSFIGRVAELDRLEEALADACAGRARAVLLGGEAGVGKSRLITEFAARARDAGARVLLGGAARTIGLFAVSLHPYDLWFKRRFRDVTGTDLNDAPDLDAAILLASSRASETDAAGPLAGHLMRG